MQEFNRLQISPGRGAPLGVSHLNGGANFALYFENAKEVVLGLFSSEESEPHLTIVLDPHIHYSAGVWHIRVDHLPKMAYYAFQVDGKWIPDPFAKELNSSRVWGKVNKPLLGKVYPSSEFDWKGDQPLRLPRNELIIYEMHVRGFTNDPSSHVEHPGTFLGVIDKIPYLKELGINAVELLPIFEFNETDGSNYWGYSTVHYFAPMARYGTPNEFKEMVAALHSAGIEILLDVVYNHVADPSALPSSFFILDDKGRHTNYTGCGNTVHCNDPAALHWILSSLRYWVEEMHVDGFRFDLASIFCRGQKGGVLEKPPLIEALLEDPLLKQATLIAEPWDCAGLYQVGQFPGGIDFAEWNGQLRDSLRRFVKGTDGQVSAFASALCGSFELFRSKSPSCSINFVTSHDGFTLHDLVSYNHKHNEENGEENRDGSDSNESWNCGVEGETDDPAILALRERQMRNFLLALFFSRGVPMLQMGDEYGHTRMGNNNAYCQDNKKSYFLWDELKKHSNRFNYTKKLISIRKTLTQYQREHFPTNQDIIWHGHRPNQPNWSPSSRFVACTLKGEREIYLAFNAHYEEANLILPKCSNGAAWKRIIDTSCADGEESFLTGNEYTLGPHSSLLLMDQI
jgi:isoamylase